MIEFEHEVEEQVKRRLENYLLGMLSRYVPSLLTFQLASQDSTIES